MLKYLLNFKVLLAKMTTKKGLINVNGQQLWQDSQNILFGFVGSFFPSGGW
jgi:hypothetical protein